MTRTRWSTRVIAFSVLLILEMSTAQAELASYYTGTVPNNGSLDAVDGQYLVVGYGKSVTVAFPTLFNCQTLLTPVIRVHMVGNPVGTDAWISLASDALTMWIGFAGDTNQDLASDANIYAEYYGWGFYDTHVDFGFNVYPLANVKYLMIYNPFPNTELKIDAVERGTPATFTPPFTNTNHPPVASDDTAGTTINTAVDIAVLNNDADLDGGDKPILTVASVTQGTHGTVENKGVVVTYTPQAGFVGTDTFEYAASDGKSVSNEATVTVTIAAGTIQIDIKPDSTDNTINLGSNGVIPVAILSGPSFDATTVDPGEVFLAGAGVAMRGKGNRYLATRRDVNGDGRMDLEVNVEIENLNEGAFQNGQAVLQIVQNPDAEPEDWIVLYDGKDDIRIVPQ